MIDKMTDTTIGTRDVLNRRLKTRDTVLTTILWLIYAYLWLPFISLIAWLIGIDFAYELVEQAGGPRNLVDLLISFGIALACIACIVIGWSVMQYWRFHDRERRITSKSPTYHDELSLWNIDAECLHEIRCGRRLTVGLDEHGVITSVQDGAPKRHVTPTHSPPVRSPVD